MHVWAFYGLTKIIKTRKVCVWTSFQYFLQISNIVMYNSSSIILEQNLICAQVYWNERLLERRVTGA